MKKIIALISITCSLSAMATVEKPLIYCEVVETGACPDYGPTSWNCNRRVEYTVACSVESSFATEEIARDKLVEIKKKLSSNWK